jgi:multidrug resistance protein, MATE family
MLMTSPATETKTSTKTSFKSLQREVKPLVNLAIPLIAGSLSFTLFGVINSYFLGTIGEVPLAAASLTMSVSIIIYGALFGLIGPIGYFIGTAYGANDAKKISEVIKHGVALGILAGGIGFVLMALALFVLPYLGQPREVLEIITPFWLLTGVSMIPFFTSFVFKQFYDSTNKPWTGTALSLISVIVYIPLCSLFVNSLGLTGAGVAAVLSGLVGVIAIAAHFYLTPSHAPYRVSSPWRKAAFAEQLKEGLPMGVQYLLEGGAITVAGLLIGLLGAAALAANQIVFSVLGILWIVPIGMSAAVGIRVAQAAGGGEKQRARSIGVTGMGIASLWSLVFTALLILWGEWVASQFVSESEVIAIASLLFIVWGVSQIFDGIQSVGVGVLRGLFDNRYPTVVSLIAYWLISLPLGYLFGFLLDWSAAGVWAGYGAGLAIASALLVLRLWKITKDSSDPLHEITQHEITEGKSQ